MTFSHYVPAVSALILLAAGGFFLLHRADAQARDTIRKHHLADIEQALFFAREVHGTFPPYDSPAWCGLLNAPENRGLRDEVATVLRQQNNKYGNQAKPFPTDPLWGQSPREAPPAGGAKWGREYDYFYWKRSPAVSELYAILEQDDNNERNTQLCASAPGLFFDYGLTSRWRENLPNLTS